MQTNSAQAQDSCDGSFVVLCSSIVARNKAQRQQRINSCVLMELCHQLERWFDSLSRQGAPASAQCAQTDGVVHMHWTERWWWACAQCTHAHTHALGCRGWQWKHYASAPLLLSINIIHCCYENLLYLPCSDRQNPKKKKRKESCTHNIETLNYRSSVSSGVVSQVKSGG